MKKLILLFLVPIFIGIKTASVYAVAPMAIDDIVTIQQSVPTTINLVANDIDPDKDTLTVIGISSVNNGTASINSSRTGIIFTPNQGFTGLVTLSYIVSDGSATDTGNVIITVISTGGNSIAVNDTIITFENTPIEIDVLGNDTYFNPSDLRITGVSGVINGTAVISSGGRKILFTPTRDFRGIGGFNYTVRGGDLTGVGSVVVDVRQISGSTGSSEKPIAFDDTLTTSMNISRRIDPRINDLDRNGDMLNITNVSTPLYGRVNFDDVSILYTPNLNYTGTDSFTYTIEDGNGGTDTGTVFVTVGSTGVVPQSFAVYESNRNKIVQAIENHYTTSLSRLEYRFSNRMSNATSQAEYLRLRRELRNDYLRRLENFTLTDRQVTYNYQGDIMKQKYVNTIRNRYLNRISQFNQTALRRLVDRIDNAISEINNSMNYSNITKSRYNTLLLALREVVVTRIDNSEDIFDIKALFYLQ
ncbi:MAG: Ig-like domain-containing protein [Candidatus Gracilibacteria bacterium]|nr:Ig-like domain-containing protein [Candidatus Gracilibacteria bacterium]